MHVATTATSHTKWQTLPLGSVVLTGGFWARRQQINRQVSLRQAHRQLERAGNYNNMRLAAGKGEGAFRGPVFMDSDIYKWLEAIAYDLANVRDPELEALAERATGLLEAAQQPDGYLDSYYQVVAPEKRWVDLDWGHEMYCAGHLIEAAVAMHRSTGNARLLNVARRVADHIDAVFGPGKRNGYCGHPEIELALVELYRETGEQRYLRLATLFIDRRGQQHFPGRGRHMHSNYHQDHVPIRQATAVTGHAVRQLYLTTGATDVYMETGDKALLRAMRRLWEDMTTTKLHANAGLGARYTGEAFGDAYELPSDQAYCETCAAIADNMWNWRMLLVSGETRYADLLERTLYNGFLSGVSLDGERYFYENPLQSRGGVERPEWYDCACCPPNVMRQIAMIGNHVATVGQSGVQVHLYMPSVITAKDGAVLRMETNYPWNGRVRVTVQESEGEAWELALRIPGWCQNASLTVNGKPIAQKPLGGHYAAVKRTWKAGDVVELELAMAPMFVEPNPRVDAIRDSVCIERGPVLYCLEQVDQQPGVDLLDLRVDPDASMTTQWREDLLNGVVTITLPGKVAGMAGWKGQLYRPVKASRHTYRDTTLMAIPYYAWANRGGGTMRVFIPRA